MRKLIVFLVVIFGCQILLSQDQDPVSLDARFQPPEIKRGGRGELVVTCQIASGYHISDATDNLFSVDMTPVSGIQFEAPVYPPGELDQVVYIYRGRVDVPVPFSVEKDAEPGERVLNVRVTVQPCAEENGICFPPEDRDVSARLLILSDVEESFPSAGVRESGLAGRLGEALDQGSILAFLLVFFGGVLTSLTPCVYPMIPITMAVIGAQAAGSKLKGFILSLFYVLGIAVTFTTLGVLAAKTGALFGSYAQHPVAVVLISVVFLVMGLSMLGVFVLQMPSALSSKLAGRKGSGFIGAFLTGLLAGLIVSPCISPLLVVILTWVAKSGSVLLGAGLLFSFSIGLGLLFILIGTFSGILANLPKSGGWMEIVERGFGLLLVGLAIAFVRPILPPWFVLLLWGVFLLLAGTFWGAFTPVPQDADRKRLIRKAAAVLAVVVSASLIFTAVFRWLGPNTPVLSGTVHSPVAESAWLDSDDEGFRQARLTNRPMLLDFTADWCTACHELDEKTWPDARVQSQLDRFVLVKLDMTRNTEQTRQLQKKYGIIGMPTVILFNSAGEELERFEGFQTPETVASILNKY